MKERHLVKKRDPLIIIKVIKTEVHNNAPVDGKVVKVKVVNDQECIDRGTVEGII